MSHAGIHAEDPRNAGIIDYLRPEPVTLERVIRSLTAASKGKTDKGKIDTEIRERAAQVIQSIESKPHRPDPPVSQPVDCAPHPWFGLGTHPDLVEALWKLDDLLPERCRWLLWGYPALVHPRSGVVFAAAFGTIGIVLRLPSEVLADEDAKAPSPLSAPPNSSPALSAWRLVRLWDCLPQLGSRAYAYAE
jgi:hypothetical protein